MKIRKGFVSNSSSSSFILNLKSEKQLEKKIDALIRERLDNCNTWNEDKSESKKEQNIIKNRYNRLKRTGTWNDIMSGKLGLALPSCNYNTYIVRKDDRVYCATSNHVECLRDDIDWQYSDFDYDNCAEDNKAGQVIKGIQYVSFMDDLKIRSYEEIDRDF
jgi:hypothetical protein